jgi:hypothetical protein
VALKVKPYEDDPAGSEPTQPEPTAPDVSQIQAQPYTSALTVPSTIRVQGRSSTERLRAVNDEWVRKYRAALVEQIPALQHLRIDEAYVAVMGRMKQPDQTTDDERTRLKNAIDTLDRLRNIP